VIAAQSIGEPGTQLTMRTFHIGGAAALRTEQSSLEARNDGTVKLNNVQVVKKKEHWVVMNRQGEVVCATSSAASASATACSTAPSCSSRRRQGQGRSAPGRVGPVRDADRHRGRRLRHVRRHRRRRHHAGDARRGHRLSRKTVIESKDADSRPRISLRGEDGESVKVRARTTRPSTSCRSAPTSSSTTVTSSRPATSSRRSRARPRRPRTSPAVCRASPSCSRPASRRTTRSSPRSTARSTSARTPRASARS
jgi:hypothetical protein